MPKQRINIHIFINTQKNIHHQKYKKGIRKYFLPKIYSLPSNYQTKNATKKSKLPFLKDDFIFCFIFVGFPDRNAMSIISSRKMMRYAEMVIVCFIILIPLQIKAQMLPPVYNYTPALYMGENQNWKICQAENSNKIYLANNAGLIEYNGAIWKKYPSPNGAILRAVSARGNKIFTGGFSEFGYWESNQYNELIYTSLSKNIAPSMLEDEEIWKIIFYDQWVLFQSLHKIFIYDSDLKLFSVIHSENNLPKAFKVKDQIYFQKMNEGLFKLVNGKEILMSDVDVFQNHIVINIFVSGENLLLVTQDKGIYQWSKSGISQWKTSSSQLIENLNIYSCEQLSDGTLVLGTIADGVYRLSAEGAILEHINQRKGLQNNTVLSVFEDREHNVWLGLDNGVSMINFFSPFREYKDYDGILGAVYTSIIHNGYLYLGTNQGLFCSLADSLQSFRLIEGTKGQVWQLKVIGNELFCGHNSGTFVVEGDKAELICNLLGTWDIKTIKNHPQWLLQGNYEGLHLLEKKEGKWVYRNKLNGFNVSSRFFEFINPQEILVSHEYKGVFHLTINEDFTSVQKVSQDNSVPISLKSSIANFHGDIWFFAKEGLFSYDLQNHRFRLNTSLTKQIFDNDDYLSGILAKGRDDKLWIFTKNNIVKISQGKLDTLPRIEKMPISTMLRNDIIGYENIYEHNDGSCILGSSTGFVSFAFDRIKHTQYEIRIDNIYSRKLGDAERSISLKNNHIEFDSKENNLQFNYSIPFFEGTFQAMYQYKLEGLYEQWSEWSSLPMVQFENLPPGEYTFSVRAKAGNVISPNTETFHFVINKPWYATKIMIGLYLIILLLLFLIINRIYKLRYKKHKQKIEKEKEKELTLMQLENDKVVMGLRNDKLRSEIESKNRELAATAMSIIRKNELLLTIKDELLQEKKNPYVKSVLNIIDRNMNDNDDWEYFQEVFGHTDREFLNRLKEKHPELTPNDIKLCIYLRLNLSSKEIAPLLNISTRSIEIKRYRLRKKMNLEHDQNLTDYILKL